MIRVRLFSSAIIGTTLLSGCGLMYVPPEERIPVDMSSSAQMTVAQQQCERLKTVVLPDTTFSTVAVVPAGDFTRPETETVEKMPQFCRVIGVATPSTDSQVGFEVWLPLEGWNGKFLSAGNGGYGRGMAGPGGYMTAALKRGYVVAGTDMGHARTVGYDASWAHKRPEKIVDWAYRATHVTANIGKALAKEMFGQDPARSYFAGCSDGGREGLMAAQRFPNDYDGVIAGAPANNFSSLAIAHISQTVLYQDSGLSAEKLANVQKAAIAKCDANDKVKDGLIENPMRCDFDPAELQCKGADSASCLTPAQVEAVRKIYVGPVHPRSGEVIAPGVERGSEAGWSSQLSFTGGGIGPELFRHFVYNDPAWDYRKIDYAADSAAANRVAGTIIDSMNPDLKAFSARRGKLILYHGLADPLTHPRNTANYFRNVEQFMASAPQKADSFARLYMVPGLGHCTGGPGVDTFDLLTALEAWVERDMAPTAVLGSHSEKTSGANIMTAASGGFTRPVCPYPQVAHYTGSGSTSEAANFTCGPE